MVKFSIDLKGAKWDNGYKPIPGLPKVKIPNAGFKDNFKPPPSGLVPTGIPGLYKSPSGPVDPRDCSQWKDSPWCGGNPFNIDKPLGLDIVPTVDECGVSVQVKPTFLYVKMPPLNVTYRLPGECRNKYKAGKDPVPPPEPPVTGVQPSKPTSPPDLSGISKCTYGQSVTVITCTLQEWNYHPYVDSNGKNKITNICLNAKATISNKRSFYVPVFNTVTKQYDYYEQGIIDIKALVFNSEDGLVTGDTQNSGYDFYDDGIGVDGYNIDGNWHTVGNNYPGLENQTRDGLATRYGLFRFKCQDAQSFIQYVANNWQTTTYVDDFTDWGEKYLGIVGVLINGSPYLPPPPPPPPLKKDCCMSCCSPSPNDKNNNDALLRQILQIVSENQERIKKTEEVLGIETYPIQAISGIDQSPLTFQTEQQAWQYLLANLSTGGTPPNLGKFPFTPDVFDTDVTQRGAQSDATPVKTVSDALQLVLKQQQILNKVVGVDQYPAKVPEWMIVGEVNGQALNNEQKEYKSLTELHEWFYKNLFGIIGQFGVNFELTDTQPGQPNPDGTPGEAKTTTTNIKLPNIAEAIAELFGLVTHVNLTVESMMNANLRTMLDVGSSKQQTFSTHMYIEALCDYFGFSHKDITKKMALGFKPGETDLVKLLAETEVDVPGIEFDQKHRFRDNMHDLLKAASIINAVHYRKFDSNSNLAGQLIDHIKSRAQASKDIAEPKDAQGKTDMERFYKEFEIGFEDESGIDDTTKPYGRPYSERPLVKKLVEPIPPQTPPPSNNPGT